MFSITYLFLYFIITQSIKYLSNSFQILLLVKINNKTTANKVPINLDDGPKCCAPFRPDLPATAETTDARRRRPEDAAVRGPHGAQKEKLLPTLDVQVPYSLQTDRRHFPNHFPVGLRALQPRLLVSSCNE